MLNTHFHGSTRVPFVRKLNVQILAGGKIQVPKFIHNNQEFHSNKIMEKSIGVKLVRDGRGQRSSLADFFKLTERISIG